MSSRTQRVARGLFDPRGASHGQRMERTVAMWYVGLLTGLLAAAATYVYHQPAFAAGWVSDPLAIVSVFGAGLLVKLLVGWMRVSMSAFLISFFTAIIGLFVAQIAPYYLLGIPTEGVVLYIPLRDGITLLMMFQAPLQAAGFLTGAVAEGFLPDLW